MLDIGSKLLFHIAVSLAGTMGSRAELIPLYFGLGLTHKEIVLCLGFRHNVQISERHLRRLLRIMGLYRRKELSDILDVAVYVDQ